MFLARSGHCLIFYAFPCFWQAAQLTAQFTSAALPVAPDRPFSALSSRQAANVDHGNPITTLGKNVDSKQKQVS